MWSLSNVIHSKMSFLHPEAQQKDLLLTILFGLCSAKVTRPLPGTFTVRQWWDSCSGSIRVGLRRAEAEGWISSPAGELFRWWDVDLQLWDQAKTNIHLDLSGSIQRRSAPCLFFSSAFFMGYEVIKLLFFVFSPSDPPRWLLLTPQEEHCRSLPMCFLLSVTLGLNLTINMHHVNFLHSSNFVLNIC